MQPLLKDVILMGRAYRTASLQTWLNDPDIVQKHQLKASKLKDPKLEAPQKNWKAIMRFFIDALFENSTFVSTRVEARPI